MSVLRLSMQFAAIILLCVFPACTATSTKFSAAWKDATYHGHPKKVLVINMFQNPSIRRLFEDEIVKALKDRKVDAVVKYSVAPSDTVVSDTAAVAAMAKEAGADTVMITRPAGTRQDVTGSLSGTAVLSVY
jgi:hypothetical protein